MARECARRGQMADSFEMAETGPPPSPSSADDDGAARPARRWRTVGVSALALSVLAVGGLWLARESIADRIIVGQLAGYGLPATYEIESIGPGTQILRNLVVGDPRRPDMTVDRVLVSIKYRLGTPTIGSVRLVRPKVYGQYRDGKLSFGSLDKVLFAPSDPAQPFALPKLDLSIEDGRGLMLTEYGKLGFAMDGRGALQNGFAGTIAAVAPRLSADGCVAEGARLSGKIAIRDERPEFRGPLRLDGLTCADGSRSGMVTAQVEARADKGFGGYAGNATVRAQGLAGAGVKAETLALDTRLAWRDSALTGRLEANAGGVTSGGARIGLLGLEGSLRARDGLRKAEFRGALEGEGLRQGAALDSALARAQQGGQGSLFAPLIAQMRASLKREERGSRLSGEIALRRNEQGTSLVMPQAQLIGGSGQSLLTLTRFQVMNAADGGPPRLAGNFTTGGAGLPRIVGTMEQGRAGRALFRLTMAPWRAQGQVLTIPEMMVAQVGDGSFGFAGTAELSGMIPGGSVRNLMLPVSGAYSATGELALWKRCVTARFDSLELGAMALDGQTLALCPPGGSAIVRNGVAGLRLAAGTPGLEMSGRLGDTPLALRTGAVGFAWPGVLKARAVDLQLGPADTATRLKLADLDARLDSDFTGTFAGVEAQMAAVPLDIAGAAGQWRFANGALVLSEVGFDLTDRLGPQRFEKLRGEGATLSLADNRITASALLREAKSGREVVRTAIRHNLANGTGHADLNVDNLVFDKGFSVDQLTYLAKGVVANAVGTVRGTGDIDWTERGVTSTGRFTTDGMDFAAAFGPVKGLSGTLEFTDLLGMVTAPHQKLKVASINPGIEVNDGQVDLTILPDQVLRLHDARWPFLGGTLVLEPTDLRLGIAEARRYTLKVDGIDAAKFVEKMELGNLAATGIFDGQFPLVFDANGGRIEEGTLVSRAPGGNVSYVGALTYEDLSPMANYAFDALKSLDYQTMTIAMRGDLEGEIVTNVKFGGVKQGAGTKQNFVTRQVANLPIQFNINIRAPFYQLITSIKAMYDPAFIKDPRTLGLVDADGRPVRRLVKGAPVIGQPLNIQPAESGKLP